MAPQLSPALPTTTNVQDDLVPTLIGQGFGSFLNSVGITLATVGYMTGHVDDPAEAVTWLNDQLTSMGYPPLDAEADSAPLVLTELVLALTVVGFMQEVGGFKVAEGTVELDGSGEGSTTIVLPEDGHPRPYSQTTFHVSVTAPGATVAEVFRGPLGDTSGMPLTVALNADGKGQAEFSLIAPPVAVDQPITVRCLGAVDGTVGLASAWRPFTRYES